MVITGNVTGSKDSIGGIVGALDCGEIIACYNRGTITINNDSNQADNVGGICGGTQVYLYNGHEPKNIIQYSYNKGTINGGRSSTGGILRES